MSGESRIGVTGLAVMGANLARNIARHDVPVAVHNRTASKTTQFYEEFGDEGPFTPILLSPLMFAPLGSCGDHCTSAGDEIARAGSGRQDAAGERLSRRRAGAPPRCPAAAEWPARPRGGRGRGSGGRAATPSGGATSAASPCR